MLLQLSPQVVKCQAALFKVAAKHCCMASYREMFPILLRFSATFLLLLSWNWLLFILSVVTDRDPIIIASCYTKIPSHVCHESSFIHHNIYFLLLLSLLGSGRNKACSCFIPLQSHFITDQHPQGTTFPKLLNFWLWSSYRWNHV